MNSFFQNLHPLPLVRYLFNSLCYQYSTQSYFCQYISKKILHCANLCVIIYLQGGDTLNSRIKEIRLDNNLNQTDFGSKIGVKQTTVAGWENGVRIPSDSAVLSICREFNINEDWLRTGQGEKYLRLSRKEVVAAYVGKILGGKVTPLEETLIEFMAETSPQEWEELARIINRFTEKMAKPGTE